MAPLVRKDFGIAAEGKYGCEEIIGGMKVIFNNGVPALIR